MTPASPLLAAILLVYIEPPCASTLLARPSQTLLSTAFAALRRSSPSTPPPAPLRIAFGLHVACPCHRPCLAAIGTYFVFLFLFLFLNFFFLFFGYGFLEFCCFILWYRFDYGVFVQIVVVSPPLFPLSRRCLIRVKWFLESYALTSPLYWEIK